MPRIALACVLLLGACFFKADYDGGDFACSDGRCPAGLVCRADGRCGPPADAALPDADAPPIDAPDARQEALTCADPGILAATGGTRSGSTASRTSRISASCPTGLVNNGPDAVFQITLGAGRTLHVAITGSLKAYVLASCVEQPSTPSCLGNARAIAGTPLSVNPAAGPSYIVVDDEGAATTGAYTLTVTVN